MDILAAGSGYTVSRTRYKTGILINASKSSAFIADKNNYVVSVQCDYKLRIYR